MPWYECMAFDSTCWKLFRACSDNEWEDHEKFVQQPDKYKLLKTDYVAISNKRRSQAERTAAVLQVLARLFGCKDWRLQSCNLASWAQSLHTNVPSVGLPIHAVVDMVLPDDRCLVGNRHVVRLEQLVLVRLLHEVLVVLPLVV